MNELTLHQAGGVSVVVHPERFPDFVVDAAAHLAHQGPVRVLDGGNVFNAYRVARAIRRRTHRMTATLEQIHVARAFTCYQMVTLLEESPALPIPTLVLNLLVTFYDENVKLGESERLLEESLGHLERMSKSGLVIATTRPPKAIHAERFHLLEWMEAAADQVISMETPAPMLAPRLF